MKVEKEVIEGNIERNLRFLEEIKGLSPERFIDSYGDVQAAKCSLLEIMEACIDIANYIISVKSFRRAEEYSEMFKVLQVKLVALFQPSRSLDGCRLLMS